jgi:hypothetical protein
MLNSRQGLLCEPQINFDFCICIYLNLCYRVFIPVVRRSDPLPAGSSLRHWPPGTNSKTFVPFFFLPASPDCLNPRLLVPLFSRSLFLCQVPFRQIHLPELTLSHSLSVSYLFALFSFEVCRSFPHFCASSDYKPAERLTARHYPPSQIRLSEAMKGAGRRKYSNKRLAFLFLRGRQLQ